jgi:hypothetical protein
MHAQARAHTCTRTTQIHTHTHTCLHARMHAHLHTPTQKDTHTQTQAQTHTISDTVTDSHPKTCGGACNTLQEQSGPTQLRASARENTITYAVARHGRGQLMYTEDAIEVASNVKH